MRDKTVDADATDCSTLHLSLLRPQGIFFHFFFWKEEENFLFLAIRDTKIGMEGEGTQKLL